VARDLPAHVRPIKEKLQGLIIKRQRPCCFAMRHVDGSELSKSEGLAQGITKLLGESEGLLQVIERLCRVPDLQKADAQLIECLRQPHLIASLATEDERGLQ